MIDLTPLEVRKKKGDFRKALRGYEPALVDDFLDIVADRLEQLVRENAAFSERVARLEQQVAENRDRERALTDALVTAQEMREEIREQTAREADLLKRSSQQQAETQLREAQQEAERLLRESTQAAEDRTRRAQQESERLMRSAQQDAERTLRVAEQQASQLRTEAIRVREQEEELLRRLRARQQQLLTSYRTFLERELAELNVITESLDLPREELPPSPAALGIGAAAVATAVEIERSVPLRPEPEPEEAEVEPPDPEPVRAFETLPFEEDEPLPYVAGSDVAESEEEAGGDLDLDALLGFDTEEPEPFEPEPVYEEDLEPRTLRTEPSALLQEQPEVVEESGEAATEPELWDAEPEPEMELELDEPADAADEETDALLENAARLGYRFDLEDGDADGPELLLEEAAEDEEPGDDDWLSSVIEEDRK